MDDGEHRCDVCGTWRPSDQLVAIPPNPLCVEWMCAEGLECRHVPGPRVRMWRVPGWWNVDRHGLPSQPSS
jgi:hypothetical protein